MIDVRELVPQLEVAAQTSLSDARAVRATALVMEALLLPCDPSEGGDLLEVLGEENITALQELYERFETDLEYEFADKILSGEAILEDYPLYGRFVRLINAEARLAGLPPEDRVSNERKKLCFIGSGSFPISAILFAQITGASVDCFDISAEAIATSEQLIEELGLSDRIRFINVAGEQGDTSGYDSIVIALLAQPKDEIAWNIKCQSPAGTRVVMRYSKGTRKIFYRGMDRRTMDKVSRYSLVAGSILQRHAGIDDTISSKLTWVAPSIDKH